MIAPIDDMISNNKLNSIVTEQLNRGRKLDISLVFFFHIIVFKVVKRCWDISLVFITQS